MSRVHVPPEDFDDTIEGLIGFLKEKKLESLPGIEVTALEQALIQQRQEKSRNNELLRQYEEGHADFLQKQADRYALFMKALNTVRALYRTDPEILRALDQFKRSATRKSNNNAVKPQG